MRHQHIGEAGQDQPGLVGFEGMGRGPVSEKIKLAVLDPVLHIAARAVQRRVDRPGQPVARRLIPLAFRPVAGLGHGLDDRRRVPVQRGDQKPAALFRLRPVQHLGDHVAGPGPAARAGLVMEISEQFRRFARGQEFHRRA